MVVHCGIWWYIVAHGQVRDAAGGGAARVPVAARRGRGARGGRGAARGGPRALRRAARRLLAAGAGLPRRVGAILQPV